MIFVANFKVAEIRFIIKIELVAPVVLYSQFDRAYVVMSSCRHANMVEDPSQRSPTSAHRGSIYGWTRTL